MNLKKPLVCVCIPTFNSEKTISETLDSLLNQTHKNLIIKIVDNSSTDGSILIIKEYERTNKNIQVFQNKTNIGGEANFTKCIEYMEGDYSAIFHADDIYLPTIVEEQVRFLETHKKCSAVSTNAYTINSTSQITGQRFLPHEFRNKSYFIFEDEVHLLKNSLRYGNIITCPTVMARTEFYKNDIQGWNGEAFKTSADLDLWLRLAKLGKFGFITKPLIKYRVSSASYSFNLARMRTAEHDIFLVLSYYLDQDYIRKSLKKVDSRRYTFLKFKDNVNRSINYLIQGNKSSLPIDIFSINNLYTSLINKQFKIYVFGIFVKALRNLPLPKIAREIIYKIRFNGC